MIASGNAAVNLRWDRQRHCREWSGQPSAASPPNPQDLEQQIKSVGSQYHDPGGEGAVLQAPVHAVIDPPNTRALVTPEAGGSGEEKEGRQDTESQRQGEPRQRQFLGPAARQPQSLENFGSHGRQV